jgi:subtilisin family serine protease
VTTHPTRRWAAAALAAALAAFALVGPPSSPAGAAAPAADGLYLVSFLGSPAAGYAGGVRGLAPTKATGERRFDGRGTAARQYRNHLQGRQDAALAAAGVSADRRLYRYTTVHNAVAAELTGAQVTALRRTPGVLSVVADQVYTVDTATTPQFLGLSGDAGVWQRQFGGDARAGEGMIIGVIDTGIWPESPSFAPLPEPRPDQDVIDAKWRGSCVGGGPGEAAVTCNNKLIGARSFGRAKPRDTLAEEFDSPRDYQGHGTHTAGTAAGNRQVDAAIAGNPVGPVSGVAPAARIATYKALWAAPGGGAGGMGSDILAAIEAAVDDGVDVLSYSVNGVAYTTNYPVGMAMFNAAQAGIFVAAAAGNNGDLGASQVNHNVPWVTTVGATTHDRAYRATVTLGDGRTVTGVGMSGAVPETAVIEAERAARPGTDPARARLCADEDLLDPAQAAGKVVLCARGVTPRTAKSSAVRTAGGTGMILYNTDPAVDDVTADPHAVPTIHVRAADAATVTGYARTDGATVSLGAAERYRTNAPAVPTFSSYGPAQAGRGDLLKPDIAAPGVEIIAPVAPPGNGGESFATNSGTSMATPHVAGIAALLKAKRPAWSPMAVKSAIMTTATQRDRAGGPILRAGAVATPLHYGAGQVEPARSFDPGLIYDSGPENWLAYMCAVGDLTAETCADVPPIDPSDLNYPSIAIGDLTGSQTVVRTVTNTTARASVYRAEVQPPPGTTVTVKPAKLVVLPGRQASFKVTVKRTAAAPNSFVHGALTWTDTAGHSVRSPIVVRPVQASVPARIQAAGATGSTDVTVRPGYDGTLTTTTTGVIPATVTPVELTDPTGIPFDQTVPAETSHTRIVQVDVPAGTRLLALGLFEADLPPGSNADLHIFHWSAGPDGTAVRRYLGGTVRPDSEEQVELYSPAAGRYEIYVDLYALPAGLAGATVKLHTWVLGLESAPVAVSPSAAGVREGAAYPVRLSWTGLAPGTRHLGVVLYRNGSTLLTRSVLRIDT